jgi:hypothetical protein
MIFENWSSDSNIRLSWNKLREFFVLCIIFVSSEGLYVEYDNISLQSPCIAEAEFMTVQFL